LWNCSDSIFLFFSFYTVLFLKLSFKGPGWLNELGSWII
jgi:hypothetical protein